jgi:hypothetical protein
VNGLQKILERLPAKLPAKQILIHGLILMIFLVAIQLVLDALQNVFLLFMPPIGFAMLILVMFGVQPVILGVLNIMVQHRFYKCEGWQIGFWLNGFFLVIIFSTINLIIQTMAGAPFSIVIGIAEIFLLAYPFGELGKFSNRGCKTISEQKPLF